MHFIQVRHFPERADGKEPETEVLLIEKDGEELEEQGNQTVQELEALAIAQRIQKLVGIEEVLDKDSGTYRKAGYGDIVILLRTSAGWAEPFSQVLASKGIPVVYSISNRIFCSTGSGDASELSPHMR